GLRYTNVTQVTGQLGLQDWLIYDNSGIKGLDPSQTYYLDPSVVMSPTAFHVTNVPADFQGYTDINRLIVPQEWGPSGSYYRLTFTGNGQITMVVPANYDLYLNGSAVQVDRAHGTATVTVAAPSGQPAEILAYRNDINTILDGNLSKLTWYIPSQKVQRALFD